MSSGTPTFRLNPTPRALGWAALVVLLVALGLRVYRLDGQSFWYDEGTSVVLAARDLGTIARDAAADIHPPLYYFLLHYWVELFGNSEIAARSLSALLGVALVGVTWAIGQRLFDQTIAITGAVLAAVSPFAVYYAQETRMYTLAALLGGVSFLAMLYVLQAWENTSLPTGNTNALSKTALPLAVYVLSSLGALYTHYFAFTAPLAANLVVAVWVLRRRAWREAAIWVAAQLIVAAIFLPWLLQTLKAIQDWPAVSAPFTLPFLMVDSLRVFSLGRGAEWSPWAWLFAVLLLAGALLPLPSANIRSTSKVTTVIPRLSEGSGLHSGGSPAPSFVGVTVKGDEQHHEVPPLLTVQGGLLASVKGSNDSFARLALILYLTTPLLVMFALSLRKPMYNPKFLLVMLPPFALLVARGALLPARWGKRPGALVSLALLATLVIISARGLLGYYFDPRQARDDYRGIAHYLMAAGRPGDGIIVNAPSQVEVFSLYYTGSLPVYPLPRNRPPDRAATEAELASLAAKHQRLFGLFWATNESDPAGIIEDWLGKHGYKAVDSWFGNLRLTMYALPAANAAWQPISARFGDQFTLQATRLGADTIQAGDVLPIGLRWSANRAVPAEYKVFVHLVDANGLIIGQHDAAPGGQSTAGWQAGATRDDNHGILIPFGTPPGRAEIRVGLYDAATGQRLPLANGGDYLTLGQVTLQRPAAPPPIEVFNLPYRSDAQVSDLTLLGYSFAKRGFDYAPDTPIHPGDEVQLTLYWQARRDAPTDISGYELNLLDGKKPVSATDATPGSAAYPLSQWRNGETIRQTLILPIPATLAPGRYHLQLGPTPTVGLSDLTITP